MSGIRIDVDAKTSQSEKDLKRINESLRNIEKTTNSASRALSNTFKGISTTIISGGAFLALKNISSEFTNLSNKIALVTGRTESLIVSQRKLYQIAEDTRSSLTGTVDVFSSFGRSLKSTGISTENILKTTKTVQQAIALSGSNAVAASNAIIQLGQGLSAGALRGEELNSVMEQAPRLAQAIADELGVTTGKMRLLAAEGKLATDVVFTALLKQAAQINKEFKVLAPTMEQSTSFLVSSMKFYVNELDKGLNLSAFLSAKMFEVGKGIKAASNNALELGANLAASYHTVLKNIRAIGGPLLVSLSELGKQFANVIPKLHLTKTLKGDINEAIRIFDDKLLGGFINSFKKFKFVNVFSIRSDVEKAITELKRLSPKYWAASGWDIPTFKKFFSKENLSKYQVAFGNLAKAITGNTNSISSTITNLAKTADYGFKALSRYFGFRPDTLIAFTGGQIDTFLMTLSEVTRGFSGITVKIWEFNRLVIDNFLPGVHALGLALADVFKELPNIIWKALKSVTIGFVSFIRNFTQVLKELVFTDFEVNFKQIFESALDAFNNFVDDLSDKDIFENIYKNIKSFGIRVINVFKDIYDKVIGNSWWTDTIEAIIDTSHSLWDKASSGLNDFGRNTINLFKDIFNQNRRLKFSIPSFKLTFDKFPRIEINSITDAFESASIRVKQFFSDLFDSFPSIAKMAFVAAAGVLVFALFPPGIIKTALLAAIVTSLATSATVIGEAFGASLTGGSFVYDMGYKLGKVAGLFVATVIREFPKVVNVFGGAISAFFRGIIEELPILNTAIKGVFSVFDTVGLAGPLGIFGTIFFGKKLGFFDALKKVSVVGPALKFFGLIETKKGKKDKSGDKDGSIWTSLFGTFGAVRTVSALTLITSQLGGFDSIFAESKWMKAALDVGLLYLSLFGDKGLDNLQAILFKTVIKPVREMFRTLKGDSFIANGIFDVIFGDKGGWIERASSFMKGVFTAIGENVANIAAPRIKQGYEFLKILLLGKDPSKTIESIKNVARLAMFNVQDTIAKIGSVFKFSGPLMPRGASKYAAQYQDLMSQTFGKTAAVLEAETKRTAEKITKIGGETGLMGRAFLGKHGTKILVGSILAAFAAMAIASQDAEAKIRTPLDDTIDILRDLKVPNPFKEFALETTAVILPLLFGALVLFRQNVTNLFNKWSGALVAESAAKGILGRIANSSLAFKRVGATIGAAVVAGFVGYGLSDGNAMMALYAADAAGTLAFVFKDQLAKLFTVSAFAKIIAMIGGLISFLLNPWVWIPAAALTAGGLLGIWLFGKEGEFFNDLDKAKDKILQLISFGYLGKQPELGPRSLSKNSEQFLTKQNIDLGFDLDDINFEKVSSKDRELLNESIRNLETAIVDAIKEDKQEGRIDFPTYDRIKAMDRKIANMATNLRISSSQNDVPFSEVLKQSAYIQPEGRLGLKLSELKKFGAELAYSINVGLTKFSRYGAKPEDKLRYTERLDELKAEQNRRYNPNFRFRTDAATKELLDLAKNAEDSVVFTNEAIETALGEARIKLERIDALVREQETTMFGSYKPLEMTGRQGEYNQTLLNGFNSARDEALQRVREKLAFDREEKAIRKFNKQLNEVETVAKNILKLEFDVEDIFAFDQHSFNNMVRITTEVDALGKALIKTSDIASRNAIILKIKEQRDQFVYEQSEARLAEPVYNQSRLPEFMSEAGMQMSPEFANSLSDFNAGIIAKIATDLSNKIKKSKLKVPGSPEYTVLAEEIRADQDANARFIADLAKSNQETFFYVKDLAGKYEVDFPGLMKKYGLSGAKTLLSKLADKEQARSDAIAKGDIGILPGIDNDIARFKETLAEIPLDVQTMLSTIGNVGVSIDINDLFNAPELLATLTEVANRLREIDKDFKFKGPTLTSEGLDSILIRQQAQQRAAFASSLKTIDNTPQKLGTLLSNYGADTSKDISALTESTRNYIVELERVKTTIEFLRKSRQSPADTEALFQMDTLFNRLTESFKNRLKKVGEVFGEVNSTLNLELTESQFFGFSKAARKTLSDYANYFARGIEAIRDSFDGKDMFGTSAEDFYKKYKAVLKKLEFIKVVETSLESISDVVTDGLGAQFSKLSSAMGDLQIDKSSFATLPSELRESSTKSALAVNALSGLNDLSGLSEEQRALINTLSPDGSNAESILNQIVEELRRSNLTELDPQIAEFLKSQSEFPRSQLDATNNLSSAIWTLKDTIDALILKFPMAVPKFASGGSIKGPGSGISDSIPAWLSNGEFVVNAKQTKKHRGLVEAINKDRLPRFADGGYFGNPLHMIDSLDDTINVDELLKVYPKFQDILNLKENTSAELVKRFGNNLDLNNLNPKAFLEFRKISDSYAESLANLLNLDLNLTDDLDVFRFEPDLKLGSEQVRKSFINLPELGAKYADFPNKTAAEAIRYHEFGHAIAFKSRNLPIDLGPDVDPGLTAAMFRRVKVPITESGNLVLKDFLGTPLSSISMEDAIKQFNLPDALLERYKKTSPILFDEVEAWRIGDLISPLKLNTKPFERAALGTYSNPGLTQTFVRMQYADELKSLSFKETPTHSALVLKEATAALSNPLDVDAYLARVNAFPDFATLKENTPDALQKDLLIYKRMFDEKASQTLMGKATLPQKAKAFAELSKSVLKNAAKNSIALIKNPNFVPSLIGGVAVEELLRRTLPIEDHFIGLADQMEGTLPIEMRGVIAAYGAFAQSLLGLVVGNLVGDKIFGAKRLFKVFSKNTFANGGSVKGPGGPVEDKIPAFLSNGEFVVNAASTKKHRALLERINSAKGYKLGGPVGDNQDVIERALRGIQYGQIDALQGVRKLRAQASILDINLNPLQFEVLDQKKREEFRSLLENAFRARIEALDAKTPELAAAAHRALTNVDEFMDKYMTRFADPAKEAGANFARDSEENFQSGLADLLKGNTAEGKSIGKTFADNFLDQFTNSVINTFAKGITDQLFGKDSPITEVLKEAGTGIFGVLKKSFFKNKEEIPTGAPLTATSGTLSPLIASEGSPLLSETINPFESLESLTEDFKVWFDGFDATLTDGLKSIESIDLSTPLAGLGKLLSDNLDEAINMFIKFTGGFASGGFVSGPGTSTSDSIPAMLSAGEFVVNAASVKKFGPLLESINSGRPRNFSGGGLVAPSPLAERPVSVGGQQIINLNITGDISRQTRSEIYAMIPQIAGGVNLHNREKGLKV
jgi:tape measure domain-containing protein